MRKIVVVLLFLMVLVASCEPLEEPKEPVCGDNICQENEEESGCKADCGGFEGITKKQCDDAYGHWNECGSPCAGTGADICIQVCREQCECGGIAGFGCPSGYNCKLSGKIADEMGVCVSG
ncbi:hypothetical protein CL615_03440 [archaeon]|nr:hypothetical protein [archaeon]MDP6547829.1 hypothetical protein [Candidatus Woesearchaeota archaeon]|tara:strand:- start:20885 stop:21247 length:363 start_codon:yes stop_codon:yes gene_type:complete